MTMINSEGFEQGSRPFSIQVTRPEIRSCEPIFNEFGEQLFLAGQIAPAGTYLEVDSNRQVVLDRAGVLPASLNGRRAYYTRLERPWMKASVN